MKNKLFYYYAILFFSGICIVITLFYLKNENKKFNQNLLINTEKLYLNFLQQNSNTKIFCDCHSTESIELFSKVIIQEELDKYIYPFSFKFYESNKNNFLFNPEKDNELSIYFNKDNEVNLYKFAVILKSFAIHQDSLKSVSLTHLIELNYFMINNEINYSRFINMYILTSNREHDKSQILIQVLKKELTFDNVYIKNLNYQEESYNPDHLYDSLKSSNSPIILEELQDDKILKIILKNVEGSENLNSSSIIVNHLKELRLDIFDVDFKNLNINNILSLKIFQNNNIIPKGLKEKIIKKDKDMDFVRIINYLGLSKRIFFHFFMIKSLINLKKFNEILKLYDSIKNYLEVYELYDKMQETLIKIIQSNFSINEFDALVKLYGQSNYLLQSSFVQYDHYFSFEFKIGMFLPIILPLAYGSFKILKVSNLIKVVFKEKIVKKLVLTNISKIINIFH